MLVQLRSLVARHRKFLLALSAALAIVATQGLDWTSVLAVLGAFGVEVVPNRGTHG